MKNNVSSPKNENCDNFEQNLSELFDIISYKFQNQSLAIEALTHPSFSRKSNVSNYQRLEFLGDAILGMVIAEILIKKYPKANEGELSKRQAYLVSGDTLSEIANHINLGNFIRFSDGEKTIGGQNNKRNLENALEAIVAAIYLDSNLEIAKQFIIKNWKNFIDKDQEPPKDPVSFLQEIIQSQSKQLPTYNIEKTGGNSHQPIFMATVKFNDKEYTAEGNSKKEAQKNVAILAVKNLL